MPIPESVKKIIEKRDPKITHIDLSNRGIRNDDIVELQELLENNPYITSIDLSYNNIMSKGCATFALMNNVESLNLEQNYIHDVAIADLVKNKKIKILNVSNNGITDKGARLLLEHLNQYKSLEILGNDISPDLAHQIRGKFVENPSSYTKPIGIDLGLCIHAPNYSTLFNKTDIFVNRSSSNISVPSEGEQLGKTMYQEHQADIQKMSLKEIEKLLKTLSECAGVEVNVEVKLKDNVLKTVPSH